MLRLLRPQVRHSQAGAVARLRHLQQTVRGEVPSLLRDQTQDSLADICPFLQIQSMKCQSVKKKKLILTKSSYNFLERNIYPTNA